MRPILKGKPKVSEKENPKPKTNYQIKYVPKEEIALKAYQIWQTHGCTHGHDREDWLKAEHELNSRYCC